METTTTKRVTLATIKSFIRKSGSGLHIRVKSKFDGMEDGVREVERNGFTPVLKSERVLENDLGIAGAWFVLGGRDYFSPFTADGFTGFEISNCCGSFILAVKA